MHVNSGKRISLQYHDNKEEAITLISGSSILHIENGLGEVVKINMELNKGYLILPFQIHRFEAITDSQLIESSTAESGNTYRLEDDYSRGTETDDDRNTSRKKPKNMKLNTAQFKTLSKVCSDIAKTIIIAVILGQGVIGQTSEVIRYQLVFSWTFISTFLLILAMMLDRHIKV